MGKFKLVELEDDLAACGTTVNVVMLGLKHVPGVRSVVDLRSITARTLCSFLMSDAEFAAAFNDAVNKKPKFTSPDHIIRAYWKRVRQPRLLEDRKET